MKRSKILTAKLKKPPVWFKDPVTLDSLKRIPLYELGRKDLAAAPVKRQVERSCLEDGRRGHSMTVTELADGVLECPRCGWVHDEGKDWRRP